MQIHQLDLTKSNGVSFDPITSQYHGGIVDSLEKWIEKNDLRPAWELGLLGGSTVSDYLEREEQ